MSSNSTTPKSGHKAAKPAKPYEGYPLFAHNNGSWAKKIRGDIRYFGPWADPQKALQLYLDQRDDLKAGREPRSRNPEGLTVAGLVNRFLTHKRALIASGELSKRHFRDLYDTCAELVEEVGKRFATDLTADDFRKLRSALSKGRPCESPKGRRKASKDRGLVSLSNHIQRIRSVFKFGFDEGLLENIPRYGHAFQRPSAENIEKARNKIRARDGLRMLEAAELRTVIDAVGQPLKAWILLGINCGFGQSDLSSLDRGALDLTNAWCNHPRPKTGAARRAKLWPETVKAIREALVVRPAPENPDDDALVFLTRYGRQLTRIREKVSAEETNGVPEITYVRVDCVSQEFTKLLTRLKLKRHGLNFYSLRHAFETIASDFLDQPAINLVMGHRDSSMAARYREKIADARLERVADLVHAWLWPKAEADAIAANASPAEGQAAG